MLRSLLLTALLVAVLSLPAAANLLPNPSFEAGRGQPEGWHISAGGVGRWESFGHTGQRSLSVTGKGEDNLWWAPAAPLAVQPGALYHTSFWERYSAGDGWGIVSGLSVVNRDYRGSADWTRHDFFARVPDNVQTATFRLGEWHAQGTLCFDDVSLTPAFAVQSEPEGFDRPLGSGESVTDGSYLCQHDMAGPGANDHRCLASTNATFNTNRWVFARDAQVTYHHVLGRLRQTDAEVMVNVNYYQQGVLALEASADGSKWVLLGRTNKLGRVGFPVPLPAGREVWIRLRAEGEADLQVDSYQYRCALPDAPRGARYTGETRYFDLLRSDPTTRVAITRAAFRPTGENVVALSITPSTRRTVEALLTIEQAGATVASARATAQATPSRATTLDLRYTLRTTGEHVLRLRLQDPDSHQILWEVESPFRVPLLYSADGGEVLASSPRATLWWCEPERKVSRGRPAPTAHGDALRISLAANEFEAAQLVVTPRTAQRAVRVTASDLVGPGSARLPSAEVTVRRVDYVTTLQPTDELGVVDEWPDPLPLARDAIDVPAGRNQPFWISVHAPTGTPPGDYTGALTVASAAGTEQVPLRVHVWGFTLPRETHVRSGFGLNTQNIRRYHNLTTPAEEKQVTDLYLQDFLDHRIAPYTFGRSIGVTWEKDAAGTLTPKFDFAGFDEDATRWLGEGGFNAFVLPVEGMGGGSFYAREAGQIEGLKAGTPAYEAAFDRYVQGLQTHLDQKGWLRKAYVYWYDEPADRDFDFVREGMVRLHRGAPRLTRMLTTHPTPALYGNVDLWCMLTNDFDAKAAAERKAASEELWWYLCTGPRAPHFGLFLDHNGTEIRTWLWETWKFGLNGILVWQTNYWTSDSAYPGPVPQNPWQDPMSWTSGYGTAAGARSPWGNGDGRFLYPPNRDVENDKTKYLEGPVPSIRWELLRDGLEDYEYFWLLREEINRLKTSGAAPTTYQSAEALLQVPPDICTDTSHFATTPEPIHRHRERLAEAIEQLRKQ